MTWTFHFKNFACLIDRCMSASKVPKISAVCKIPVVSATVLQFNKCFLLQRLFSNNISLIFFQKCKKPSACPINYKRMEYYSPSCWAGCWGVGCVDFALFSRILSLCRLLEVPLGRICRNTKNFWIGFKNQGVAPLKVQYLFKKNSRGKIKKIIEISYKKCS